MSEVSCYKCEGDCDSEDNFCRHCGAPTPGQGMSWDWKEQPNFGRLNKLLRPYGVQIEEVKTESDQSAILVRPLGKKQ